MADNKDKLDLLHKLIELQENYNTILSSSVSLDERERTLSLFISTQKQVQAEKERLILESKKEGNKLTESERKHLRLIVDKQKEYNSELNRENILRQSIIGAVREMGSQMKTGFNFLMQSDKVIKSTILNLGLSGAKADAMRASFEQSSGFVTRLGGSIADIGKIQEGYADETGRARVLTASMVEDITLIGKGTGLGIEQAAKLAGQFELMGTNTKSTKDYVQGVVDVSERMGVNSTKVLKNISDNFKKLNTYTFQQGSKGFAQMAMYAEKMNISMSTALDMGQTAKTLEGALDMAAQLQVMGGNFAKADWGNLLYSKRNDPAKFAEMVGDMTKGLVTFRKMSDGTFTKFISPADRDRMEYAAKALGISVEEMNTITHKQADLGRMAQELDGRGLTKTQKELIKGAATFDTHSGKFQVQIAGKMRDISSLTQDQAKAFVSQTSSLKERAEQAQTFDEVFKATIETLKSALLPILRGINVVLKPLSWLATQFSKLAGSGPFGIAAAAGTLMTAGLLWKGTTTVFQIAMNKLKSGDGFFGKISQLTGKTKPTSLIEKMETNAGGVESGANAGKGLMRGGIGIGAAAVGIGGGIALAAVGISKLADSMQKLDKTQIDALPGVISSLAVAFLPFAVGLAIVGTSANASMEGLLSFGASVLMIGGGIGIAAAGIGYMAKGLSDLVTSAKGSGESMMSIGTGMAAMGASLSLFTVGSLGLASFGATLAMISLSADGVGRVGESFKQINAVLSGNKEDYIAVANAINSIASTNVKGGGMFAELANILKTPLKVEFADKNVAMVSNITLDINGEKLHQSLRTTATVVNQQLAGRLGQGTIFGG